MAIVESRTRSSSLPVLISPPDSPPHFLLSSHPDSLDRGRSLSDEFQLHSAILSLIIAELKALCEKLHRQVSTAEEEKYDLEVRLQNQDAEVRDWTANSLITYLRTYILLTFYTQQS